MTNIQKDVLARNSEKNVKAVKDLKIKGWKYLSILMPTLEALKWMAAKAICDGVKRRPASVIVSLLRNSSAVFRKTSGFSNAVSRAYRKCGKGLLSKEIHIHNYDF